MFELLCNIFNLDYYNVTSLSIVGLSLEIAGGVLLAMSTFLSSKSILNLAWATWGPNPKLVASYIEDRINGLWGILGVGCGFVIQIIGQIITIVSPSTLLNPENGKNFLLVNSLVLATIVVVLFLAIYSICKARKAKKLAIKIVKEYEIKDEHTRPNFLVGVGDALGWEYRQLPADADGHQTRKHRDQYIKQTFGIPLKELNE